MARKPAFSLPAPFLRQISWADPTAARPTDYPFSLPWLRDPDFTFDLTTSVTILTGENGVGKSTLLEAIAALAGYDEAGGGKGYRPVDHSRAEDRSGIGLAAHLRARWLPKVTDGWFFRAESFYSIARYLDEAAQDVGAPSPDFLSWSHGEGFLRFFAERVRRRGLYILDEPESALSPARQLDLLALLAQLQAQGQTQVIIATHSPLLMALPEARLLHMSRLGIEETTLRQTRHFELYRAFGETPETFIKEALAERQSPQPD